MMLENGFLQIKNYITNQQFFLILRGIVMVSRFEYCISKNVNNREFLFLS